MTVKSVNMALPTLSKLKSCLFHSLFFSCYPKNRYFVLVFRRLKGSKVVIMSMIIASALLPYGMWLYSMPQKIQPIAVHESRCIFPWRSARTSHGLCWSLYFLWHDIKQLFNALSWYTMKYPNWLQTLVFPRCVRSPKGPCVYQGDSNVSWDIPRYSTRERWITSIIIHWTRYLFSDWPKAYGGFSKSAPVTS